MLVFNLLPQQLQLSPTTLIDEIDSGTDVQKFVWVMPNDDNDEQQFALKTYGESHFLAFKRTGDAVLVPGAKVNPEVTIFRFTMTNG